MEVTAINDTMFRRRVIEALERIAKALEEQPVLDDLFPPETDPEQ